MSYLSFQLDENFVKSYEQREVDWGFPCGAGNSLGEIAFIRTYSRKRDDGTKEKWHETVRRVVEGCYSIQRDWCMSQQLPWSDEKAQSSAQEMYERIFTFKFTPPGRGLEMMGTEYVMTRGSAALQNCAFVSTDDFPDAIYFLMEASMLGVGVGFDTSGAGEYTLRDPGGFHDAETYIIPDSREGWAQSVVDLVKTHLVGFEKDERYLEFDYSAIRPEGALIKSFGGKASGPEPLRELHENIRRILSRDYGKPLTGRHIVDVMNMIGRCVISGNVRRSAEIALGPDTDDFKRLKDFRLPENDERLAPGTGWGWSSNNSVIAEVGKTDYEDIANLVRETGEPGIYWLDIAREYGRLGDDPNGRDYRVRGVNPCGEQPLESKECCNLVETYPTRADDLEDFKRTLKFAYLYAKSVTLLPTHWEDTNAIMLRNRRIGTSVSGVATFLEQHGLPELRTWLREGYDAIQFRDRQYSEWLCVRPSIKTTTVKPSGTVSLLAGVTPGVHFPVAENYWRRMRLGWNDPLVEHLRAAGYEVLPAPENPERDAMVVLPVTGPKVRSQFDVSVWEKAHLAATLQRDWSDNGVSVTLSYRDDESDQIAPLLRSFEGQFKAVSFERIDGMHYEGLPYEGAPIGVLLDAQDMKLPLDRYSIYDLGDAAEAIGEKFCTTDVCEVG